MKATVSVLFLFVAFLCVNYSTCGLVTKWDTRGPSSLKGAECKSYQRNGNQTVTKCFRNNATDDNGSCDIYKHATDEVSASFDVLVFFPDKNILLSETDSHHDEHCEDAKQNLKVFEKHAKCVEGPQKQFVVAFAKGLKRVVKKRCISKAWHKKFIKFSTCMKDEKTKNAFHVCGDRLTASFDYAFNNIAKENQTRSICCFEPLLSECFHKEISDVCGKNDTDFIAHTIFSPVIKTFISLCKGQWEELCDAKLNAVFHKIFSEKHENLKNGLYQAFFNVIANHPHEDIKVEEHE